MVGCIIYGVSTWTFSLLILLFVVLSVQFNAYKSNQTRHMTFGEKYYWKIDERAKKLQARAYSVMGLALVFLGVGIFIEFFGLQLGLLTQETVCPNWVQTPRALRMFE